MSLILRFSLLTACCLMYGCGPPAAKLTPVTGSLTIDGVPAGGIMVQFTPDTLDVSVVAPTSQAITDDAGNFELYTTKHERGAIVGSHLVTLVDTLEERPEQGQVATKAPRLDAKFAIDKLTVNVEEGKPVELKATGPK